MFLDEIVANWLKSPSQKIRKMTEFWASENIYCPSCGDSIIQYSNNKPVADFYCEKCREDFELKAWKSGKFSNTVMDGSYKTMIERLESSTNPNFFVLQYNKNLEILNYVLIPKYFVRPENIIPREKGIPNRPNYIMCNISLVWIPESGKIFYIKDKEFLEKEAVLTSWEKTCFLQNSKWEAKGWLLDIIQCIESLWKRDFTLDEMYAFESTLKQKHPENNFINDKIRQQLQVLRDKGYLEFKGRGIYSII